MLNNFFNVLPQVAGNIWRVGIQLMVSLAVFAHANHHKERKIFDIVGKSFAAAYYRIIRTHNSYCSGVEFRTMSQLIILIEISERGIIVPKKLMTMIS